jgi:hypothetical protein
MWRAVALAWAASLVACQASPPEVNVDPGDGVDGAPAYADALLVQQQGGELETCSAGLGCPVDASCAEHPALGEPDGATFRLAAGDRLELGFICAAILDQGGGSQDDFRIIADVPANARAVIAVSADAPSDYELVDVLTQTNQPFDLQRAALPYARYISITHDAGDPITIDAIGGGDTL